VWKLRQLPPRAYETSPKQVALGLIISEIVRNQSLKVDRSRWSND
jgi:hypothetical protein